MAKSIQQRIIFGLKVRHFRQVNGWNFDDLASRAKMSVSYLNEIEKGKKYPLNDNLNRLAQAFEIPPEALASPELPKSLAPIGDLLQSNFLNELPLDLFGIELQQVIEIIARAPDRVNAFISALLEIARNYSLRDENFYFAALRAYQELHMNLFEDIEQAAEEFVAANHLPDNGGVPADHLAKILKKRFGYKFDEDGLDKYPELASLRSVFIPQKKRLLLNARLSERQKAFQLGKELGFNVLDLEERPLASSLMRVKSFEEVLNNYRAAYFSVAILINRQAFVKDLRAFFAQTGWNAAFLLQLLHKYQASPEVLFQRFNVLAGEFNLHKVFFQRFIHDLDRDGFDVDKELHLNRKHQPHASGLNEHYCRRWLSLTLLRDLQQRQHDAGRPDVDWIAGVQRAQFLDTGEEYLCFAVAKPGYPTPNRNISVVLGILLDADARRTIRFWNDPSIARKTVNVTCERCALLDCAERAAAPVVIRKRDARRRMEDALFKLTGK